MNTLFSLLTPRRALALAFLLAASAMATGYYIQHVDGIEPCPLCIVQRLAFVVSGLIALLGALFGARALVALAFASLAQLANAPPTPAPFPSNVELSMVITPPSPSASPSTPRCATPTASPPRASTTP